MAPPGPAPQTLTFLFTDLEGSTRLWERHPVAMRSALARHDALDRRPGAAEAVPRRALGEPVVEFYVHTARLEVQAFDNAVTDWERVRYFERI